MPRKTSQWPSETRDNRPEACVKKFRSMKTHIPLFTHGHLERTPSVVAADFARSTVKCATQRNGAPALSDELQWTRMRQRRELAEPDHHEENAAREDVGSKVWPRESQPHFEEADHCLRPPIQSLFPPESKWQTQCRRSTFRQTVAPVIAVEQPALRTQRSQKMIP